MRFKYNIYPEAISKLESDGLAEKVRLASKENNFGNVFYGATYEDDVPGWIDDMKKGGFFKTQPQEIKKEYGEKLNKIYKELERYNWTIIRPEGEVKENAEVEDFLGVSGAYASMILKPDEFWDFKKFRFDSLFEFFGTLGAFMRMTVKKNYDRGYTWTSELPDGTRFVSLVSGSEHGDLRIHRTDMTPYETIDPTGTKVAYRPELNSDTRVVAGHHSVEQHLLVTLLKYAEQERLHSEILKNKDKFMKEISALDSHLGPFADAGYDTMGPRMNFLISEGPIPKLNEKTKWNLHQIPAESGGSYGIFVDDDKNLVFAYGSEGHFNKDSEVNIPSSEIDHLIRGLFVQASKGLGRTSVKQLADTFNYRFSEQFEADQKEFRR